MLAIQAPAKLNLCLRVLNRRADGYHDLYSVMTFVTESDTLYLHPPNPPNPPDSPTPTREPITLTVRAPRALSMPASSDNLVYRAAQLVRDTFGISAPLALTLDKRLPIASGIGGGSSDAAACLKLLAAAFQLNPQDSRWQTIAQRLGADVPFCWHGTSAIAQGIGERLQPITLPSPTPPPYVVLANPNQPTSTADVFQALTPPFQHKEAIDPTQLTAPTAPAQLWQTLATLGNDLAPIAQQKCPSLTPLLKALQTTDTLLANVSGSGATCFALYETKAQADTTLARLRQQFPSAWLRITTLQNTAPPVTNIARLPAFTSR
ncbi:MAG: 4-(cytidine 5'-diphospho)-2-C-methyl-D-erythritol kinase [Alphaproteobacteria bacterium GM202ARS2]|nr:4-(cytidine 5'-diphospho)-2-C-methyl-D-erythritol kinase [Alphaproteobacteria bacterium GM202ARS2]